MAEVTGGEGFDFTLECIGMATTMRQAYDLTRRGGTCCIVGVGRAEETFELNAFEMFLSEKTLVGSMYGGADVRTDSGAVHAELGVCPQARRLKNRRTTPDNEMFTRISQKRSARKLREQSQTFSHAICRSGSIYCRTGKTTYCGRRSPLRSTCASTGSSKG